MTLHWWMHWFWVTMLLTVLATTRESHAAPRPEGGEPERQARAMYFTKPQPAAAAALNVTEVGPAVTVTDTNSSLPDQVQWTPIDVTAANATAAPRPAVAATSPAVTAPPEPQNTTFAKRRNLTRPAPVQGDLSPEGASESRIVTEKPLSLETTFLQTRIPPNVESSRRVVDSEDGLDAGAIAGISFAVLVVAALVGSTVLVLYRRRYLNKPQTLNDKCSNPDSSGYLDDSTIRDNSEEMYSLDNDSFLNSLEAMTIQNYWTDTVKHTKL